MNAIEVKNLSKIYTLRSETAGRISLRLLLSSIFRNLTTKLKKTTNQFLALDSLSFSVKKGETIGLIGPNGSGKSTLLRLLSGITRPTSGTIILDDSLIPLLSLGLGFHPDLTGRENIYLNAALLNYPKKTLEKEIKHIIAFSDLGRFIDTPVKYYSSGMYARLGFSIATAQSLEPDILLVDETLAVGDEAFHKKSFQRLRELTKKEKTTIIFVSHDLQAIKELCSTCLWLEKGKLKMYGSTNMVINRYKKTTA